MMTQEDNRKEWKFCTNRTVVAVPSGWDRKSGKFPFDARLFAFQTTGPKLLAKRKTFLL